LNIRPPDHAEKDMKIRSVLVVSALFLGLGAAWAEVIRHPIPNSNFPIAQSVEVSGNTTTYYISGQVPPLVNKDADPATPHAYGDTRTQTIGVLNKIKGVLEGLGLGMGDVVKMQVFLVNNAVLPMDFKAFMEVTLNSSAAISLTCRHVR
jgi:enamine deaminase RidA (YjgF/YER057c/UK114 family)